MTRPLPLIPIALAVGTLIAGAATAADAPAPKPAAPAATSSAAKPAPRPATRPAVRPAAAKTTPARSSAAASAATAAAAAAAEAAASAAEAVELTPGQLAAAERVFVGPIECGPLVKDPVLLAAIDGSPGHFELSFGTQRWRLRPEETQTGAVRLEDPRSGVVWLQIPAKSMLLDMRSGQRVLDGCTVAEQRPLVFDARDAWRLRPTNDFGITGLGRKD